MSKAAEDKKNKRLLSEGAMQSSSIERSAIHSQEDVLGFAIIPDIPDNVVMTIICYRAAGLYSKIRV